MPNLTTAQRVYQDIRAVYDEEGISGVMGAIQECYEQSREIDRTQAEQKRSRLERCFLMDWFGYRIDNAVSLALGVKPIEFFSNHITGLRFKRHLLLVGLDFDDLQPLLAAMDEAIDEGLDQAN